MMLSAVILAAAVANGCGTAWDPVQVLPVAVRKVLSEARGIAPCRVTALPEQIRDHLAEVVGDKKLAMADPDQEWDRACMRLKGLPSRQLVAAANVGRRWVVHYREGGEAISDWAVVFELDGQALRESWRGSCVERPVASRPTARGVGKATRQCVASSQ